MAHGVWMEKDIDVWMPGIVGLPKSAFGMISMQEQLATNYG